MILGRQLTAQERRRSQHLYCAFNFVNGMSYMCLGESLLVLFAAQLGAPNAVVALLGAMLGMGSSFFVRGMRETGAIRDAARAPLLHGMIQSFRNADLRRLVIAWFFLNLVVIMLVPISMLALKRGCGFDDGRALVCACAQFTGGIVASFGSGPLCRRFGVRRTLVVSALGCATVPIAWLAFPASSGATGKPLWPGIALFFWIGALFYIIYNVANSAFLMVCPDKKDQVAGSIAANLLAGAGAGIAGSALGAWLVSRVADWAPALGADSFAVPLGPFRLYFLLLLPIVAAAAAASLRIRINSLPQIKKACRRGPHLYILQKLGIFRNRLTRDGKGVLSDYTMSDPEKREIEQRMRYCGLI